ncbi:putative glycosyltransferase [Agrobacterium rubi TR3 = NBRC 13261]|uniref:Putative glycosyltransferase n=1 Tax=Agrobacterium rubi TR3 = NBRC 13261 TaxID=1368415 RepID=A0A081CYY7_9HYPH|nr:putative glycosyltransferase [Agrobacterium rubi TR3 = NBRC 13261]
MKGTDISLTAENSKIPYALGDMPVSIKIDASGTGKKRVCIVKLHRKDRIPETITRSLLLDERGHGIFFGWMPVDLQAISLALPDGVDQRAKFTARPMTYLEMVIRLACHSPKTMWQALRLLLRRNIRGFQFRIVRLCDSLNEPSYRDWRQVNETFRKPSNFQDWPDTPDVLVSIVGDPRLISKTRDSITAQTYPHIQELPAQTGGEDFTHNQNCVWIRLTAGMELSIDAIERLVKPLVDDPNLVAVYCDEDRIDTAGERVDPFFKPAWNPPLAQSGWLAPDGAAIRVTTLAHIPDSQKMGAAALLMAASQYGKIGHLPAPLLHRRDFRQPASILSGSSPAAPSKVSVIIPTRDRADLLSVCLAGLYEKTRHDGLDVIVIDNDSCEPDTLQLFSRYEDAGLIRRIPLPGPFNFAKACNIGVSAAEHDLVLLLNNDVDPLHPEWLDRMIVELEDERVGACGPLLLFRDGFVQHAGVTLGAGSVARHSFHFRDPDGGEDYGLISQRREISAVTAACMLTRKKLWMNVGGMNERTLSVAFNDVDYCLKLGVSGQKIIWTPHARLTHLESVSRLADDTPEKRRRFASEEQFMHEEWSEVLLNDPHYNPNLSLAGGDHVLDALPRTLDVRTPKVWRNARAG